ncbi:MAG: hypothetical protein IJ220_00430 [Clostridia bacterium]|nr:hypothetical protein [Clostridia bacterium]
MKKQIVIINGTGGSGKDTFVEFCSKYGKVMNFSSVDKVKEIAQAIGWDGKKTEKARKFLSDLKRLTTEFNDMSFNSIKDAVAKFKNSDCEILFIHIREPEEIERAANAFNAKTLLVKRIGLTNISSNYSDANVEKYEYDFIIENTTLEDLDKHASSFIKKII